MLLIQCFTLVFYSAFLVLKGLAEGISKCEAAMHSIFSYVQRDSIFLSDREDTFPHQLEFYFTPDENLLRILDSLKRLGRHKLPFLHLRANDAIILDTLEFGTEGPDFRSVKFTVENPDGEKGTAKIICKKESCDTFMDKLEEQTDDDKKLPCLKQPVFKTFLLSATPQYGIVANFHLRLNLTVHWSLTLKIFNADSILTKLIKLQNIETKDLKATKAILKDNIITIEDKDGTPVAKVPLPDPISSVALGYIQAAVKHFNFYEEGMIFKVIDKSQLTPLVKAHDRRSLSPAESG